MAELKKTLCNRDCPDVCQIIATVEDGRVTRLQGDPDHPVTQGFLCHRTNQFLSLQYSPERVTQPLLRRGGAFVPISWDDALDLCARELQRIKAESGPAAIFHYRSGGSLGLLKVLTDHFFEQFGPVTIKSGDICSGAGDAAQLADFGEEDSSDLFDLLNAKQILLWGKNVFTSSPHSIPVLKQARSRGAELVLLDPVHHKTASLAQKYLQVRPGGDLALALAVARVLFEEGWTSPEGLASCDHVDDFRALAFERSVAERCAEADVPVEVARDLAWRLGPGGPCTIVVGWGMGRRERGAATVRALDALGAISGNLGRPGGGVSYYFKRRGAFDTSFVKGEAVAPRTVCEPMFGVEVPAMKDPPIRALWVTCGNPVAMLPQSHAVADAIRGCEFVVVADAFLTDTARLATLVLPTPTLLETDDLLGSYGHHFIGVARPVVPPPPQVRSDLEIIQGVASRVGLGEALAGTAREWQERLVKPRLGPRGVTLEQLEAGPLPNPLAPKVIFADRKFATPTGRVQLMTGVPAQHTGPSAAFPLTLMALSTERSQSAQWAKVPTGPAVLTVHPDAAPGFADGAQARLESRLGFLTVQLKFDPKQRRDVALMPKGGHLRLGQCANAITEARTTDAGGGGALYDEPVRLAPLAPAG
jgi:anaerobic selenocysteine-containing dehydrogenase